MRTAALIAAVAALALGLRIALVWRARRRAHRAELAEAARMDEAAIAYAARRLPRRTPPWRS